MSNPISYKLSEHPIDVYVQKSMKFLYPLLKISVQPKIMPIQTYLVWENEVAINSCKLICLFEVKEDVEFSKFERTALRGHELFVAFFDVEDNKRVYIFDMKKFKADMFLFLKGKYSQLSEETKLTILDFYYLNKFSKEYMDSFLNPENYFEKYAELLNISERSLRNVGELCNLFDRSKEKFKLRKNNLAPNKSELLLF